MTELEGKVVVVTGAAGGIGAALCRRFAAAGARIFAMDVDKGGLATLADELSAAGASVATAVCDITDDVACKEAIATARAWCGGIDVLVNNAGITARAGFDQTLASVFRRVMDVNFYGSLHCTQAALPSLKERRGRIVVISSVAGVAPLFGRSGYAASKHALHGMFETARAELAADGVSVTMVCPSFTESRLEERALGGDGGLIRRKRSQIGKTASAESVAAAIVRATVRRRRLLVLSPVGKLSYYLSRVAPRLYERAMVWGLSSETRGSR